MGETWVFRYMLEGDMEMGFEEDRVKNVISIYLVTFSNKWWAVVNAVVYFWVP